MTVAEQKDINEKVSILTLSLSDVVGSEDSGVVWNPAFQLELQSGQGTCQRLCSCLNFVQNCTCLSAMPCEGPEACVANKYNWTFYFTYIINDKRNQLYDLVCRLGSRSSPMT